MGDRYVTSDENEKILLVDAKNFFGRRMSQTLPLGENKIERDLRLGDKLSTPDH